MKKATKEKKSLNNRKKIQNSETTRSGIFDYDSEVEQNETKKGNKKRLTRKVKQSDSAEENNYLFINSDNKQTATRGNNKKENKAKIKKLQKRKKKEKAIKNKNIVKEKKEIQKASTKNRINAKQIKRMRTIKKAVKFTFIVFILCTAIVLFVLSPIFNINDITISKNEQISREAIIGLLNIDGSTNIFKENNSEIRKKLKENPYIDADKTTIRRILPSTLVISIKERSTEFLLEFGSTFAYIDKDGYILEISNNNIEDKIKIRGYQTSAENIKPGRRLCDEDIAKLEDAIQIIKISKNFDIYDKITSINIEDSNDYQLFLESEKKTVHMGNNTSIDTKMLYVKAILEKEKDNEGEIFVNVDLNGKNPYFKQNV